MTKHNKKNGKNGSHRCGRCGNRLSEACKRKGHMVPCPIHTDAHHVPGDECVSCKETRHAEERVERSEREAAREAERRAEEEKAREELLGAESLKKKREKAAKKERDREKRRQDIEGYGLGEDRMKKVKKLSAFGKPRKERTLSY
ncbi:uncharacterized protein DSM5745_00320 [Aspergillus mulundensis]|uniref:Uncharacterized protein n=1 Tax=Aspergillus mulundensis TaxID=1810919 RepID=A0A3D8T4S6_9EURO|nr:hypothetical protein DSM5745_00320 [Aspergillus mulundensis]RDW92998.1 hypothetical protein DSM5745_00320 [Aspergillus mulundensis]